MKPTTKFLLPAGLLVLLAGSAFAQDQDRARPERPERPDRPPLPPIIAALDADQDGEISAAEIENAAAALKTLDKNGDGKLTRDEIGPPRGPRDRQGPPPRGEEDRDGPPPGGRPEGPRRLRR